MHIGRSKIMLWTAVILLIALACCVPAVAEEATVTVYPGPEGIEASPYYSVEVNGEASFAYVTRRSSRMAYDPQTATFTSFVFEGCPVEVKITVLDNRSIDTVVVRPLDEGITAAVEGNVISFMLADPAYLSVEINGDTTHKCFIFADEPEKNVPSPDDENVWYFGPGVHDIGATDIPDDKNIIYIAGGAYVKGKITSKFSKRGELQILGRGIFSGENNAHSDLDHLIQVNYASRFVIDGPILLDSNSFHLDILGTKATADNPNVIHNLKEIAWVANTDGFHVDKYIDVDNVFIYNYDDALDISQYSVGGTVRNCVIWNNDYGGALLLGWGGVKETGNVTVQNIDVIHFNEADAGAANTAVIMANHGEKGLISNIYVDDLRVECFDNAVHRLFSIRVDKSPWSSQGTPYGAISNIHLTNIRVDDELTSNVIQGKNDEHMVEGVLLENISINGVNASGLPDLNLLRNEYATSIRYTNSYVQNGSFEKGSAGWNLTENAEVVNLYEETLNKEKAFNGHCVAQLGILNAGEENIWQQITDLPDGQYRMTVQVKTSGLYDSAYLYAESGAECYTYEIMPSDAYTYIKFDGIQVTGGTCEIGAVLKASAPAQLVFDQVVFEMK